MTGPAATQLVYLLDQAFEDDEEHSLLVNLRDISPDDWHRRIEGVQRSIRQLAYHAGVAKHLYADHLFGAATTSYDSVLRSAPATRDAAEKGVVITWMREGHQKMRDGVASLADGDLETVVRSHWGAMMQKRRLISGIIQHDAYHAGEINHLRAMLQGNDGWWPEFAEATR
jgi:uncharacterized damage-inducible protein DinB